MWVASRSTSRIPTTAMAESPFLSDDPRDWQQAPLPAGHPSKALLALRDKIPENTSLPPPAFFMDPRAMSAKNMTRDALGTMANWIGGNPQTKDMIGPTGGAGLMAAGMTKPVANTLHGFIAAALARWSGHRRPGTRAALIPAHWPRRGPGKAGHRPAASARAISLSAGCRCRSCAFATPRWGA